MSVVAFILHYMTRQLALIDTTPRTWKLDSHTCELGLQQVQEARAILERVRLQKAQSQESAAAAASTLFPSESTAQLNPTTSAQVAA